MSRAKQSMFSTELSSKSGHEAIVGHFEGELKYLEHLRDYMAKRAKVELDYASALSRINVAAAKFNAIGDCDSPVKKVSRCY